MLTVNDTGVAIRTPEGKLRNVFFVPVRLTEEEEVGWMATYIRHMSHALANVAALIGAGVDCTPAAYLPMEEYCRRIDREGPGLRCHPYLTLEAFRGLNSEYDIAPVCARLLRQARTRLRARPDLLPPGSGECYCIIPSFDFLVLTYRSEDEDYRRIFERRPSGDPKDIDYSNFCWPTAL